MIKLDWKTLIPDTLIETYVQIRGEEPEGSFIPDEALIADLLKKFKGCATDDILDFLKDSMYAHMKKTQKTKTRFFVQNLLAPASLEYLRKYGSDIREFYIQKVEPIQFSKMIYGAVYEVELDFLEVMTGLWSKGTREFMWELLSPNHFWLVLCEDFGRKFPPIQETWPDTRVEYSKRQITVFDAYAQERKRLRKSTTVWEYTKIAFHEAMRAAAVTWATRMGFIYTIPNTNPLEFDKETFRIVTRSDIDLDLLKAVPDLTQRDTALLNWASDTVQQRAQEADSTGHQIARRLLEHPEKPGPIAVHKHEPAAAAFLVESSADT